MITLASVFWASNNTDYLAEKSCAAIAKDFLLEQLEDKIRWQPANPQC